MVNFRIFSSIFAVILLCFGVIFAQESRDNAQIINSVNTLNKGSNVGNSEPNTTNNSDMNPVSDDFNSVAIKNSGVTKEVGNSEAGLSGRGNSNTISGKAEPNFVMDSENDFNTSDIFYRMLLAVVIVAGLGAGVMYFSKKYLPKYTGGGGRHIRIIETTSLGSRRMLQLTEVEGRRILIGITSEKITKIAEFGKEDEQIGKDVQE